MDDITRLPSAPVEWIDVLAESDTDLKEGRIVPGEVVMRDLYDSLARLEGKRSPSAEQKVEPGR